ncbi:cobyrinate a,c-diamide synthase [Marivivens sp. LCG002]|uniref:cobyrinate a,c-diamide synthase n=1 Tax=Marivivens sp. LCG002 TaxID=3051171 RepID=UPI002557141B|nr:cobyrinate a,c-diamide synthase [Marivivens sp. LCG002]WIV51982.1 cobyrinate a,c-diamide synthase [Marivivens sp. LCG002]
MTTGVIVAAPSSGSGKTTLTLGLLRALRNKGIAIRGAKSGPDYIDPQFHSAACGSPCLNLDAWAMTPERILSLAQGPLVIEGAMGLFDGAPPDGKGATADLARFLRLPVILVIDAAHMAHSVAAVLRGFASHDPEVRVGGVILNKVGSPRHEAMLRSAIAPLGIPVLGAILRTPTITQPSRHLGLVQALEHPDLEAFIEAAARLVAQNVDLDAVVSLMAPLPKGPTPKPRAPAQRIAVARDEAFAFAYPHQLGDWRAAGAEITFFSPLADETVPKADFVFLPGGYPELHAGRLAASHRFLDSLRTAAQDTVIYGECGGYMTLGEGLIDKDGVRHRMAGLLPLETSFETRKLHLGYRSLTSDHGPYQGYAKAHEFHYATTLRAEGDPLFAAKDAEGNDLGAMGLRMGNVFGSFAHIIDF